MNLRQLLNPEFDPPPPEDTEVLEFQSPEADEVFDTLASKTAREMLGELYENASTASELAATLDISLQNVNYHLNNLRDANLIVVADMKYSVSGREMKVYSPSRNAVVLLSEKSTTRRIRSMISELLAVSAILAVMAVIYRFLIVEIVLGHPEIEFQQIIDDGRDSAPVRIIRPLDHLPLFMDPGFAFIAGGILAVVALLVIVWVRYQYSIRIR